MFTKLKEKAEACDRAYIVFHSRVQADLVEKDNPIIKSKLTFHVIAQGLEGTTKNNEDEKVEDASKPLSGLKDYIQKCIKTIKGLWRKKITKEFEEAEKLKKKDPVTEKAAAQSSEQIDTTNPKQENADPNQAKTEQKDAGQDDKEEENDEEFRLFEAS